MRIVVVVPRYPWPARRGDQVRAVQAVEALAGEHEVTLVAPEPVRGAPGPPTATEGGAGFGVELYPAPRRSAVVGVGRAALGGLPWSSGLFWQRGLGARLRRWAGEADLVILQLVRLVPHLGDLGGVPVMVDLIDCLSLNAARRARLDRWWLRPVIEREAGRLARAEERLVERSRRTVVVCERDRAAIAGRLGPELAGRLGVVPVAVAAPGGVVERAEGGEREVVALTGNLGYFVNADAACWFCGEVWPRLVGRRPGVELVVAGARPPGRVRRAVARAGGRLLDSPPDLGAVLAGATVAVAPLRGGSGVPVKVLEAWAAGVPVVASPHAAAGAGAVDGEELLVADGADDWVETLGRLLDDPDLRTRLAAAGRERLRIDHDPEAVVAAWRRQVGEASGRR